MALTGFAQTYVNPVIINSADPGVYYHAANGYYYVYATDYRFHRSQDLVNWLAISNPLADSGMYWAPEVFKRESDGFLYMFYTMNQRLRVAKASSPAGPFNPIATDLTGRWSIDSSYFRDDNGKEYIYWNEGGCGGTSGVWVGELDSTLTGIINPQHCFNNIQVGAWVTECVVEGPYMLKHNGVYYLTFSANGTGPNYKLGYATATSPSGPWTMHPGNPIMAGNATVIGPGHASFTRSPDGSQLFILYHSHRPGLDGRHTCVDKASFVPNPQGGPDILTIHGPTSTAQPYPLSGITLPASGAWAVNVNGNWNVTNRWLNGIIASGGTNTAWFTNNLTANRFVTNDVARTIGHLEFGDADPGSAGGWTITGPATLTLAGGAPPTITVNELAAGRQATISAPLAGTQRVTKLGVGELVLRGNNTYSGGTTISAGTVTVGNGGSLGAGSVSNDAALVFDRSDVVSVANAISGSGTLTISGGGDVTLAAANSHTGGTIVNGATATPPPTVVNHSFETPSTGYGTWAYQSPGGGARYDFNSVSGFGWTLGTSAGLDKNSGTWYTPSAPGGGAAVFIQGSSGAASSFVQALSFTATGAYTIGFHMVGRGGSSGPNDIQVQMDGAPLATISAASQSQAAWQYYTVPYHCTSTGIKNLAFVGVTTAGDKSSCIDLVTVSAGSGRVVVGNANCFAGSGGGGLTVNSPAVVELGNQSPTVKSLSGDGTVDTLVGGVTLTINPGDSTTFSGAIRNTVGDLTLVKNGTGMQTLTGPNTFGGQMRILRGTLIVDAVANAGSPSSLGTGRSSPVIRFGNANLTGILQYMGATGSTDRQVQIGNGTTSGGGGSATIYANGSGALTFTAANFNSPDTNAPTTRTLTLRGTSTAANTIQGIIADNVASTAPVTVTKNDAGSWVLAGNNTYSGNTSINAGTLRLNGALATGTVTVNGGTLEGTGLIRGPVTVQSGGTLSPGASIGALTVSNTLILAAGSTTVVELNAQTLACDRVQGMTTANYGGTLVVSNLAGTLAAGQSFPLFNVSGSRTGNFSGISPATPGPNLAWEFNPTNGTLSVVSAVVSPPTLQFTSTSTNTVVVAWEGPGFHLQTQTNALNAGLSDTWFDYPGGGSSPVIVPINPAHGSVFLRLVAP